MLTRLRNPKVLLTLAFFVVVAFIRTHGIPDTFQYLTDQIRDWRIARGSWSDIPLVGPSSFAGGYSLGPIQFWFVWLTDLVIGPFTDHLPHAGGIGTALLQAAGDTCLFVALQQRLPTALALATSLLIATAPFDVAVSATIWNPSTAVAFMKMTMALALTTTASPTLWRIAGIATLGWIAVQSHTTAVLVIVPLFAAFVVQPMMERRWRRAVETLRVIVEIVVLLQIPYVIHAVRGVGRAVAPGVALGALATFSSDLVRGGLETTVRRVADRLQTIAFASQESVAILIVAIIASMVIVIVRWWRQPILLALTVAPILAAVVVYLPWRRRHMYEYWVQAYVPSMFLLFAFAIAAVPWRSVVRVVGYGALVIVLALLPLRFRQSKERFRFDWYKPLVAGIRTVAGHTKEIHDIQPAFHVEATTDIWTLYQALGGREQPESNLIAVIQPNGDVVYRTVR